MSAARGNVGRAASGVATGVRRGVGTGGDFSATALGRDGVLADSINRADLKGR